jgi:hypothetical protein
MLGTSRNVSGCSTAGLPFSFQPKWLVKKSVEEPVLGAQVKPAGTFECSRKHRIEAHECFHIKK